MAPNDHVNEVLVLETDRLCSAVLNDTLSALFPLARVRCESEPTAIAAILAETEVDLFVVGLRGFDFDVITLLGVWAEHNAARTKVLVVTPNGNSTAVMALRVLPVSGVFDSSCNDLHEFELACTAIVSGTQYWSLSVGECLNRNPEETDPPVPVDRPYDDGYGRLRLLPPFNPRVFCRRPRTSR